MSAPTSHTPSAPEKPHAIMEGGAEGEAAAPDEAAARKKREAARPSFASDPKFERLVPMFGVSSVEELDDKKRFSLADFQRMASLLHEKATGAEKRPGAFKKWTEAVDSILAHADFFSAEQHAGAEGAGAAPAAAHLEGGDGSDTAAAAETLADEAMAEVLSIVNEILSGNDLSAETEAALADAKVLAACEKALAERADHLEAAVRTAFETALADESQKVSDILELVVVSLLSLSL